MESTKKTCIWLTTSHQGHYKDSKIKTAEVTERKKNLDGFLWFTEEEKEQANEFLKDYRKALYDLYCKKYHHHDRVPWMTKEWVEGEA